MNKGKMLRKQVTLMTTRFFSLLTNTQFLQCSLGELLSLSPPSRSCLLARLKAHWGGRIGLCADFFVW